MQEQTSWWLLSDKEVLNILKVDPHKGLTLGEAASRLKVFGAHVLSYYEQISPLRIFFRQFFNVIILILVVAAVLAAFLGSWVDAVTIGVIVLINAFIGFFQEYGAEQSLAALRRLTKPTAYVLREGVKQIVPSSEVVPGDIVLLEAGDLVPADGRIVSSHDVTVDESSLTGESLPVTKQVEPLSPGTYTIGDRTPMVFMGTQVVKGRGSFVVTATGVDTHFGMIAQSLSHEEEQSSLQKQLKQVGTVLIGMSLSIAGAVTLLGMYQGTSLLVLLFTSLSLFIAAVPEGLPAVITVALARVVKRMAKRNALIRRLSSVETLGSVSVICTDKTGTITQNRMLVTTVVAGTSTYVVTDEFDSSGTFVKDGLPVDPSSESDLKTALSIAVLCNGAELTRTQEGFSLRGDPTEGALLVAAAKAGLYKDSLEKEHSFVKEFSFDSRRKRMSILRESNQGLRLYVKGSFGSIIERSTKIVVDGVIKDITLQEKKELTLRNEEYAKQALRIIAVAYRDGPFTQTDADESDLIFVGLFAMIDPPRPEVKKALHAAEHAGIRTIMLTGDHKETARAIGNMIGLLEEDDRVLSGIELDELSDEKALKALETVSVFARISVDHKIRLVNLLKQAGERVAMTGDGVNDAPALKKADIGIAMGITGTDVAKEASDMIITDDNYASIVSAIKEGRGLYESLVKFVNYLLSSNLAELLVVFWGALVKIAGPPGQPLVALLPVHLLWINLISDGIPAIALVFDPLHKGLMHKRPEIFRTSLVAPEILFQLIGIGVILSIGVLAGYIYGLQTSGGAAQTMAFTMLVLFGFVRLSSVRAEFNLPFFSNPLVIAAAVISLLLQLLLLYVPALQELFMTVPLSASQWGVMLSLSFITWLCSWFFQKLFSSIMVE